MNVIRQAYAANVYKVIMMSTFGATLTTLEEMYDGSRVFTNKGVYNSSPRRAVLHAFAHYFPC